MLTPWKKIYEQPQFSSVAQSCPTLCDPMDCSTTVLCVHHQLPEFTQTPVHWVSDAIQPSHPLLSPSPSAFNLSQHQGLSNESGGQSIGVSASTSVLPMKTQDWSPLRWTGWVSLRVGHNFPSKERLLISRLQLPSAVILDPPKIKSATVFTVSPPT